MSTEKTRPRPKIRRMVSAPEPVPEPEKPKRKSTRTKLAGWEKGVTRLACVYLQDHFHQGVNLAASALRISRGVFAERAILAYLKTNPDLEGVREALAGVLGEDWKDGEGEGQV